MRVFKQVRPPLLFSKGASYSACTTYIGTICRMTSSAIEDKLLREKIHRESNIDKIKKLIEDAAKRGETSITFSEGEELYKCDRHVWEHLAGLGFDFGVGQRKESIPDRQGYYDELRYYKSLSWERVLKNLKLNPKD